MNLENISSGGKTILRSRVISYICKAIFSFFRYISKTIQDIE